jgi:hypothetical protein
MVTPLHDCLCAVLCTSGARSPHGQGFIKREEWKEKKKGASVSVTTSKTDMRDPDCGPQHGSFPPRTCGGSFIFRPRTRILYGVFQTWEN